MLIWFGLRTACPRENSLWSSAIFLTVQGIIPNFQVVSLAFSRSKKTAIRCCFWILTSLMDISYLNFWDKAWWFLSLRVFGLLSSFLLLFPQCFGWHGLYSAFFRCLSNSGTCMELRTIVMFWPFDPAKNAIQGGAPEGSDTSRSLEIGRGCVGVEACLYYCVGVWR